jgi:hypothetical protein
MSLPLFQIAKLNPPIPGWPGLPWFVGLKTVVAKDEQRIHCN